ncbi:hypothetical protein N8841_02100 [Candidatus Pelagibacter sp.]|nr:hypothetical protein [Candidatus Pelagibacter sp.]|tara:strand:- start:348 stop:581 length:234 start_codon:yes stop_codon:yes gene_type:complete
MFDGPWGGFLGLIVFGLLTVIGYKYFDGPRQLTQKEREAEQKRIKEQLEWDKILEEENKKKIIREYKRDLKKKKKNR